jgi:hypothetical protein
MARGKQTRRQLLAGCASAGAAVLAGCSASGSEGTTTDNERETTVAPTEVGVAFGDDGEIDLETVTSDAATVEVGVVAGDGNPVAVDNLTVTISSGTAELDSEIVRQVTGESVTVTFDGDEGVSLPDGASEGTLDVGIVTPPNSNLVDQESNASITVVA